MNCIHLADYRGQNVASCSTKRYEFLECITENDFLRRILLHSVRFSPSYLMMLFQLQRLRYFQTPCKPCVRRGRERGKEWKL